MSPSTDVLLTAAAMRAADETAISEFGIPGFTLMETAGRAAVDRIEARYGPAAGRRVGVVCGRGNNGGDGLVVARTLLARGAEVSVAMVAGTDRLSKDADRNHVLLTRLPAPNAARFVSAPQEMESCEWLVDAMLGTGLTQAPRAPYDVWIEWMNTRRGPVVALDVPSGLDCDRGTRPGVTVRADLTVTMGALKCGLLLGAGPASAGIVDLVEIGIPAFVLTEAARQTGCAVRSSDATVRALLNRRAAAAHKFSTGPTLVIGGSRVYPGAPVLAATAAARIGSGYVLLAGPEDARSDIGSRLLEIPFIGFDPSDASHADLESSLQRALSVLVGPGLGRGSTQTAFVLDLLERLDVPTVIDADGLNALSDDPASISERSTGRWLLTPHGGEFARLTGGAHDLERSPIEQASTWAARWNAVVLLKGQPSVVAAPDGRVVVCSTGNDALATAGTGDVLAGFCAGLLATGLDPFDAAVAAVHVGGATADAFALRSARRSMVAGDLIRLVGRVLLDRFA